jgi:hypothetical protein
MEQVSAETDDFEKVEWGTALPLVLALLPRGANFGTGLQEKRREVGDFEHE